MLFWRRSTVACAARSSSARPRSSARAHRSQATTQVATATSATRAAPRSIGVPTRFLTETVIPQRCSGDRSAPSEREHQKVAAHDAAG